MTDFCTVTRVSELASYKVNKPPFGRGRLREKYKRWTARVAENYMTTATSARANARERGSSKWLTKGIYPEIGDGKEASERIRST